ncbi:MAG: peptidoglycan DD-metalloendopeptidase family protein [Segetibacter sp.]|jgi:murein DD-endopeptidase MepM/ murein hydrolase activator NlpD|nr:peptidoglycan DD-metalloendopeptidase family protein [Segetibacter sp.]
MRKLLFLAIILFFFRDVHGQKEDIHYKKAVEKFQRIYNAGNYDSLFYLFSPEMRKELPLEKTISFLSATKSVAGKMLSNNFENYESSYASYKTQCERRLYSLYISLTNNNKINGLLLQPYTPNYLPRLKRNATELILPFSNLWSVLWGGDTKELNYHVEVPVQKGAFDFIVIDSTGKAYKKDSKANEDYYAFGKDIIASCDGEVVLVVDGVKDNVPGYTNPMFVTGNTVMLKTDKEEYFLYAHCKKHSIVVKEGQKVKQGQLLGQCGNSGNSLQPHLHFHIQNVEDLNIATGAKCYFDTILVNGVLKTDYSPIKNERIQNKPQ